MAIEMGKKIGARQLYHYILLSTENVGFTCDLTRYWMVLVLFTIMGYTMWIGPDRGDLNISVDATDLSDKNGGLPLWINQKFMFR